MELFWCCYEKLAGQAGAPPDGKCVKKIAPVFNRLVVFKTDKSSFHGHTSEWKPRDRTRRSVAMYYYTRDPEPGQHYDAHTDFQSVVKKDLPHRS